MNYVSACIWQKKEQDSFMKVSLVLQCIKYKGRKCLFACVCKGNGEGSLGVTESGYFTEGLTEWFHRDGKQLGKRKTLEEWIPVIHKKIHCLQKELEQYGEKHGYKPQLDYTGILLAENQFLTFSRGNAGGYLLNKKYQRKNMGKIGYCEKWEEIEWAYGKVQHKVGILLCNDAFFEKAEEKLIAEVLIMNGEYTEKRMERRMLELWKAGNKTDKKKESLGAVYIRIK